MIFTMGCRRPSPALLAVLCLALIAGSALASEGPAPISSQNCAAASVEELLPQLEAPVSSEDGTEGEIVELFDPLQGAIFKAIDSGRCCSRSSDCPSVSGYSKFCGNGSCPTRSTCLYNRL